MSENNDTRMGWDDYFIDIAGLIARRSTCVRRMYGAVIVKDNVIVSTGYNGAPRGHKHCSGGTCERVRLGIPSGQQYEKCVAVHAEQNALIKGDPVKMEGAVIYIMGFDCATQSAIQGIPCEICRPMLINAGITRYISRDSSGNVISTQL